MSMKHQDAIRILLVTVVLMLPSTILLAQEPVATSPRLRIGAGDLLEVKIFDAPEMTQTVRVDDAGDTTLNLVGKVHLAGLTAEEGQKAVHPDVSILIHEYITQGASILGEVGKPGVYPVLGNLTLLNIISAAGGMTPTANNEVTVQRHSDASVVKVKLSADPRKTLDADIEIQPGDKVIVPRAGIVYVIGNVNHPGGFVMQNEGQISLLQAIALAEGVNGTASLDRTKLIRKTANGYIEIPVSLKKILKGRAPDMPMQAQDILFIPNSASKSMLYRGLPGIVQAASGAAIYSAY